MERSEKLLSRDQSVLVAVDLQDTFLKPVKVREQIVANVKMLVEIARQMEIPLIATTQNAEKLGSFEPTLGTELGNAPVINKLCFSCMASEEFAKILQSTGRTQVVLVGVEAHICIMQTALDLLKAGYSVHVPYDAVASRYKRDWKYALLRLAHSGVVVTSLESVVYEWLHEAGTESFRRVLPLLKARDQQAQQQEEDSNDEEEATSET